MKGVLPFAILLALSLAAQAASEKPNFIVIMVDDMGYAGVSCFGNPHFQTPEIDRLAAEGMRLTDFHSSGTVCSPTRAGLLTGRYQQRAGIEAVIHPDAEHPEHRKGLKRVENTFAELLREKGRYSTGLVGKWHQGYPHNSDEYHPQEHGFDEFVGYHSGNIDYVSHVGDHVKHDWWHGREETAEEGYATHLINRHALEFIQRHGSKSKSKSKSKSGEERRPFCLYLAHLGDSQPGAGARGSGAALGGGGVGAMESVLGGGADRKVQGHDAAHRRGRGADPPRADRSGDREGDVGDVFLGQRGVAGFPKRQPAIAGQQGGGLRRRAPRARDRVVAGDPGEKQNVAAANADLAQTMAARLVEWYAQTQATATPQEGGWLNEASTVDGRRSTAPRANALSRD